MAKYRFQSKAGVVTTLSMSACEFGRRVKGGKLRLANKLFDWLLAQKYRLNKPTNHHKKTVMNAPNRQPTRRNLDLPTSAWSCWTVRRR